MKQDCEYYINKYLMLDKGERLGKELTKHFLKCIKCKEEVRRFSHAEKIAASPIKLSTPVDMSQVRQIMDKLDPDYSPKWWGSSLGSWIFFGVFLLVSLVGIGSLSIKSNILGFNLYISFAVVVILYSVAFFACNLDFFIKRLHLKISG